MERCVVILWYYSTRERGRGKEREECHCCGFCHFLPSLLKTVSSKRRSHLSKGATGSDNTSCIGTKSTKQQPSSALLSTTTSHHAQVQNPRNRLLVAVDRHKLLNHSVEFRSCFRKTFVEIRRELNCVHVAVTILVEFSNHPVVLLFRPRSTFLPESATGFTQGLQLFLTDTPAVVEIKVIVNVLESTDAIRFLVRF